MEKEELNGTLHEKIFNSSELLLKRDLGEKSIDIIPAIDCLNDIVARENLNEVSDIYIYEEAFADTDKPLKDTIVHAIASIIAFNYRDENLTYIENIALAGDDKRNYIALDYLLKIGRYHAKFQDRVLTFIEQNFNGFGKNKLNIAAFYLVKLYPKNARVEKLFKAIHKIHQQEYNANESPASQNTNTPDESSSDTSKPWWKFW
ncbi:MAG: hypothetical protein JWQ57_3421 [Mucilaginibacter sp.]|nr:hypothetical protein [Mucilaginibacter sp.]